LTLILALVCFFAAAIAVGLAQLLAATPLPAWVIEIIKLGTFLIAYIWLRTVLGV
jgi:hypothetical protein